MLYCNAEKGSVFSLVFMILPFLFIYLFIKDSFANLEEEHARGTSSGHGLKRVFKWCFPPPLYFLLKV